MQRIGIVLLFLLGLSGSEDILGKKRAWLLLSVRKFVLHPLIHTFLEFNLAQNIGSLKGRDVEKRHPPPNGPAKYQWRQEEIMKSH